MSSEEDNSFEEIFEEENEEETADASESSEWKADKHAKQLERLREKDPEFYEYLKEHDKELLDFVNDDEEEVEKEEEEEEDEEEEEEEDNDEDVEDDADGAKPQEDADTDTDTDATEQTTISEKGKTQKKKVITAAMVDEWCTAIQEHSKLSAVQSLLRAFRTASHYGEGEDESGSKFSIMSSSVFNKIMLVVLSRMDRILRGILKMPASGGKKETVLQLMSTKTWKNYHHLVKSYLGNALHVLNQMTDTDMIAFTLRRLKYSAVFLAAFPSLLRKYIKVNLHFWGTGGGALPVVSFLFIRDLCVRLGSDCLDECFKGMYKAYVMNCQFVNATKLQHIQFLGNCIIELYGVDLPVAYQHAFVFIRQLAMILREALTMKTKETFRKVYEWKFMNCLELWTGAVCAYSSEPEFRPLAYPLTQIISGATRLVPTARYFPLRLRCARMLNRIAASTGTFIPVSLPLLDMLEMKELNRPPTGGVGKAIDLRTILKVSKPILKTRGFQEACVFSVIEELGEHLSQWSYSIAFFELAFIPALRLRSFCKSTKIERFRRETRELIRQIEANSTFTNAKRATVTFLPNDPAAESFLEDEKKSGISPLSRYADTLRQKAQKQRKSMVETSVIVGDRSSTFGKNKSDSDEEDDSKDAEEGSAVFSSSWFPKNDCKTKNPKEKKNKKKKKQAEDYDEDEVAVDEDIVGELVLSSDEDDDNDDNDDNDKRSMSDSPSEGEDQGKPTTRTQVGKKRKLPTGSSKKGQFHNKKPKRKQNTNKKSLNR